MNKGHLIPVIGFADHVMVRGKGSLVYDAQDSEYIDLNAGQFCTVLGHSNSTIDERVYEQMHKILHTASDIVADEVLKASDNLYRLSGDMKAYSITLCTGAEAVEFTLRYAKHITGKEGVICFNVGYHGLTLGAQSVTYSGRFACPAVEKIFPVEVPTAPNARRLDEILVNLEQLVAEHGSEIACMLFEPVVSVGGMIYPPDEFFAKARKLCTDNDIILIFDESQTGFGRLGTWFAYQRMGVVPDMVVLAKGVGNGYPVSVAMFSEDIIKNRTIKMSHYSSHQNDALAAAVINASIDYIEENNVLDQVRRSERLFLDMLTDLAERNSYLVDPRGKGLMLGADISISGVADYRPIYAELHKETMRRGVIIQGTNGGHTLRFLPDYLMPQDLMQRALDVLGEELTRLGELYAV